MNRCFSGLNRSLGIKRHVCDVNQYRCISNLGISTPTKQHVKVLETGIVDPYIDPTTIPRAWWFSPTWFHQKYEQHQRTRKTFASLAKLKAVDADFELTEILNSSWLNYVQVCKAFSNKDRKTIKQLCNFI